MPSDSCTQHMLEVLCRLEYREIEIGIELDRKGPESRIRSDTSHRVSLALVVGRGNPHGTTQLRSQQRIHEDAYTLGLDTYMEAFLPFPSHTVKWFYVL